MKRPSRPRAAAELSKSVDHQLSMYALAASAAGVGLLALAQPAEAKIVYTPAHIHIKMNGDMVPLDLNHDGIVDFYLHVYGFFETVILSACQYTGSFSNGTVCSFVRGTNAIRRAGTGYGAALPYGARIQPIRNFGEAAAILGRLKVDSGTYTQWMGPWLNGGKGVKHRYLGLKFKVKGRFHVGWARMTVVTISNNFTATLTGYAYETIPGKGIIAGKTKGPDVTTVSPATLGHLAAGASAIPTWRVKQTKSTTH